MGFQKFEATRKSDLPIQSAEIAYTLDKIRRHKSDKEFTTLIRALNIVTCAFRPLTIYELIEALTTDVSIPFGSQKWEDDIAYSQSREDLERLWIGFLEVHDSGVVIFSSDAIKHFILSGGLSAWKLLSGSDGHENLAMASIRHLQYLDPSAMLEPEKHTQHCSTPMRHKCAFLDYVMAFWHQHSRIADAYSRYVPAILHQNFVRAITFNEDCQPTLQEQIDTGLWLCTFYRFRILCRTYLEMGANPNSQAAWHASPIHTAAKVAGADIVRLLLDRGGDLALCDEEGLTPLQVALSNGNFDAANVFIDRGPGFSACEPSADMSPTCARPQLQRDRPQGQPSITKSRLSRRLTEATGCHVEALFHTMSLRRVDACNLSLAGLKVNHHHGASMAPRRITREMRNELAVKSRTKGLVAPANSYRTAAVVSNLSGPWRLLTLDDNNPSYDCHTFSLPYKRRRGLRERLKRPFPPEKSSKDDIRSHVDHKLRMLGVRWCRLVWLRRRR